MECRIKEINTFICFFMCVCVCFYSCTCIVLFVHNRKVWNFCCSDLNRYNVNVKIKASHTHDFPPRNEPKRMYNGISPFVGFNHYPYPCFRWTETSLLLLPMKMHWEQHKISCLCFWTSKLFKVDDLFPVHSTIQVQPLLLKICCF